MGLVLTVGIIVMILILLKVNKINIDWASLLAKTLPLDRGIFGVYCFEGKQGSGKTYALTKYLIREGTNKKIYSNMTFTGIDYEPIRDIEHLLSLRDEKEVFIVYDEILNLLNDKSIPRDIRDDLFEFLTQQRKMKNILFTTTQEWLSIPIEFRRFVRIQIICATRPLGRLGGLLREEYCDAYNMKWEQLENEYIAPRMSMKWSKYERKVMESYNTFERVKKLARSEKMPGVAGRATRLARRATPPAEQPTPLPTSQFSPG